MLYELWQQIAREYALETALSEPASGRCWTFQQLADQAEFSSAPAEPVLFPQGSSADFVIQVLRAWRHRTVCCPLEAGQKPPPLAALPKGTAHIKITSATTGDPHLITFTGEQLAADVFQIISTMGLRRDWPNIGAISIAHSYGFSNLILPLLLRGIPLTLIDSPLPTALQQAARAHAAITLAAVPALWRAWHEARAIPANVRLAISAGAPLPLPLEQSVFETTGLKIHNFYGSSECGGIAYDRTPQPRGDASCVGAPMDGVALSIGESGCLEVRSQAVAGGYWPAGDERLGHGIFKTSDLAELIDGQVFLRGRASDLINVAGRKVSPESIERALVQCPGVDDCLVFSVPDHDSQRAEIIVACVAAKAELAPEKLRQFLLNTLPAWQIPREWVLLPALPVNERGKLSRAHWREKYLADNL